MTKPMKKYIPGDFALRRDGKIIGPLSWTSQDYPWLEYENDASGPRYVSDEGKDVFGNKSMDLIRVAPPLVATPLSAHRIDEFDTTDA